jgi:hypothetical protein
VRLGFTAFAGADEADPVALPVGTGSNHDH